MPHKHQRQYRHRYRRRRQAVDPMISMINVVFLLIAFFMLGQFQETPPVAVTLPTAHTADKAEISHALWIDQDGVLFYPSLRAEDALQAIQQAVEHEGLQDILIRADKNTDANRLIQILSALRAQGVASTYIEVAP